jgi:hypothetical protein
MPSRAKNSKLCWYSCVRDESKIRQRSNARSEEQDRKYERDPNSSLGWVSDGLDSVGEVNESSGKGMVGEMGIRELFVGSGEQQAQARGVSMLEIGHLGAYHAHMSLQKRDGVRQSSIR